MGAAIIILIGLNVAILVVAIVLLARKPKSDAAAVEQQLAALNAAQARVEAGVKDEIARFREEAGGVAARQRQELGDRLKGFEDSTLVKLGQFSELNTQGLQQVRGTLDAQLKSLQEQNSKKLDEMRQTVDEKLHATLEARLGEAFKQVSERLEKVHQGLGEMQNLAAGVGDLKKILSNVKTRGVFGEVQLERIIEEILTPEQYEKNVATKPGSNDRVEFALRLPGRADEGEKPIWLPIDAKFPMEDYHRLLDAYDAGDLPRIDVQQKSLRATIEVQAGAIRDKYLDPPHTTDFAIMFLATESLYAEVLRIPGLMEFLQQKFRVTITGPTTLAAVLNSLQMGFRTLAIAKRSSEVWDLLGAVKTQFDRFGEILEKTQKKLTEASNLIEKAESKTKTISRRLRTVQLLPQEKAELLLPEGEPLPEPEDDTPA
jgi:DNA recombination protein RmuC